MIAVCAAGAGAALGQGDNADRFLEATHLKQAPTAGASDRGGLAVSEPTAVAEVGIPTATADEARETAPGAVGQESDVSGGPPPPTSVAADESSEPSPEAGGEDLSSAAGVAEAFASRWSNADYDGLYDLLSSDAQAAITREDFVGRYVGIATESGLTAVSVEVTGQPNLETQVPIHVALQSRTVGEIEQDNVMQLSKEADEWRIAWTPSLIFRSLGNDCIDYTADVVHRGSILDRNGEPLALDGLANVVGIIPGQIKNESQTLKSLGKLIGMSSAEIKKKYQDGEPTWFMPVKQFADPMDDAIMNGIGQLDGVAVRTEIVRVYPLGAKAAHITGYATRVTADDLAADTTGSLAEGDLIGRTGLESGANEILAGTPGGRLSIVDCGSRVEKTLIAQRAAVQSQDLILSIDKDFQVAVDAALGDGIKGSAVVIDPRNGAVLALASHPSYDPNWFVTGFSDKNWAFVNDESQRPLLNRAAEAAYPTGSIFKVITMAAGMEHLDYSGDTEFDCPQEWSIPGTDQIWRDWTVEEGLGPQGVLTLHQALVNSCNTVFYQIGNALDEKDDQLLPDMVKAFGLGSATGIPYLPEVAGTVPDPAWKLDMLGDYWARGDAVNLSIGQGYLEATPLQMANAYTALANGGTLLQPFIVEFTQSADGSMTRVGKRNPIHKLPLGKGIVAEILSALRDQTSDPNGAGSVRVFGDMAWPIGGKTGTAQNQIDRTQKPHSWFAAFGPYGEKATIASIVMVESSGEGVLFAAPRTRQIYDTYLGTDLAEVTDDGEPPASTRSEEEDESQTGDG